MVGRDKVIHQESADSLPGGSFLLVSLLNPRIVSCVERSLFCLALRSKRVHALFRARTVGVCQPGGVPKLMDTNVQVVHDACVP